jgi:hypothetical protein
LCAFFVHHEVVNIVTETPHGHVPWEIGHRSPSFIELLPSVI